MEQFTLKELAQVLLLAFKAADVDPARDTIVGAVEKFQEKGLRHLLLHIENGGFLCLCADPEMSAKIHSAIEAIEEELEAKSGQNMPAIREAV